MQVFTIKRFDFVVQGVYNKTPWFWRCFKNRKMGFSGINCLLRTTGVKIPPKFLGYFMGHPWGAPTVLM
jgi:hypothetical protein